LTPEKYFRVSGQSVSLSVAAESQQDRPTDQTSPDPNPQKPERITEIAEALISEWGAFLRETPTPKLCGDIAANLRGAPINQFREKLADTRRKKPEKIKSMGLALSLAREVGEFWRNLVAEWQAQAEREGFNTDLEFAEAVQAGRSKLGRQVSYPPDLIAWARMRLSESARAS
jgi:hypothetical protein